MAVAVINARLIIFEKAFLSKEGFLYFSTNFQP